VLPDLENLKPYVLEMLQRADEPLLSRVMADALGLREMWSLQAVIRKLRDDGYDIRKVTCRGYWLYDKGEPPKYVPKSDSKSFENLHKKAKEGKLITRLDSITYPIDWAVLEQAMKDRGLTAKSMLSRTKLHGWPAATCASTRFYNRIRVKNHGSLARGMTWNKIWAVAQALELPPELLIDEDEYLFRGVRTVVPARFAGYKLLFGALKLGMHPVDVIPPFWARHEFIEEIKTNPEKHQPAVKWLHNLYKGDYHVFKNADAVLYICTCTGVSPAELFVACKIDGKTPLSSIHTDITALPQHDVLFLAAVARLLHRSPGQKDTELISNLAVLVGERAGWKEKLRNVKKAKKSITAEEAGGSQGCSRGDDQDS